MVRIIRGNCGFRWRACKSYRSAPRVRRTSPMWKSSAFPMEPVGPSSRPWNGPVSTKNRTIPPPHSDITGAPEVLSLAKLLPVLVLRRAPAPGREPVEQVRAQMAGENFPVALRLLPPAPRRDLVRVYAFARFVDDIGDDAGQPEDARLARLDAVEDDLLAGAGSR